MTVQELIDILNNVEDKSLSVEIPEDTGESNCLVNYVNIDFRYIRSDNSSKLVKKYYIELS